MNLFSQLFLSFLEKVSFATCGEWQIGWIMLLYIVSTWKATATFDWQKNSYYFYFHYYYYYFILWWILLQYYNKFLSIPKKTQAVAFLLFPQNGDKIQLAIMKEPYKWLSSQVIHEIQIIFWNNWHSFYSVPTKWGFETNPVIRNSIYREGRLVKL